MLMQACPCTQTAVCQSDNLWLTDQQCRFKFNPPGHGYNFHKGTVGLLLSAAVSADLSSYAVELVCLSVCAYGLQ